MRLATRRLSKTELAVQLAVQLPGWARTAPAHQVDVGWEARDNREAEEPDAGEMLDHAHDTCGELSSFLWVVTICLPLVVVGCYVSMCSAANHPQGLSAGGGATYVAAQL